MGGALLPVTLLISAGIAAIGPHFIACGLHTGTIVLFEVTTDARNFVCRLVDSQRLHAHPIMDLASTTVTEVQQYSTGSGQGGTVIQQRALTKLCKVKVMQLQFKCNFSMPN